MQRSLESTVGLWNSNFLHGLPSGRFGVPALSTVYRPAGASSTYLSMEAVMDDHSERNGREARMHGVSQNMVDLSLTDRREKWGPRRVLIEMELLEVWKGAIGFVRIVSE